MGVYHDYLTKQMSYEEIGKEYLNALSKIFELR